MGLHKYTSFLCVFISSECCGHLPGIPLPLSTPRKRMKKRNNKYLERMARRGIANAQMRNDQSWALEDTQTEVRTHFPFEGRLPMASCWDECRDFCVLWIFSTSSRQLKNKRRHQSTDGKEDNKLYLKFLSTFDYYTEVMHN